MKTITQAYQINAPVEKVWQALVDPQLIAKWTGKPAVMAAQQGFEFKLWDGDIYGKNTTVVPNQTLVQEWYGGDWPQPSIVSITLSKSGNGTQVDLVHENVPDSEYKSINEGWKDYYFGAIKELLEKVKETFVGTVQYRRI